MNHILVPIDFSLAGGNVLRYAFSIARHLNMDLTLLHCYSLQEFNRPYDFGKKKYSDGIRNMLMEFYKKHISEQVANTRFLAKPGPLVDTVALISSDYALAVLGSKNFDSNLQRWMGSSASYIASKAQCPVIIKPLSASHDPWKKIWHIKRKDNEKLIIEKHLAKLKINPAVVEVKSFQQTTFASAFWQSIVAYVKTPKEELRPAISAAKNSERIDLILMVSHDTDIFQKFVTDDAMQVIFQFDIPVLIFQANTAR